MYKYLAIIILLCNAFPTIYAGALLTQEDAIRLALKHNFDISVAYTQAQTAHIRNAPGNAGMLPSVGLTGAGAYEPANSGNQKLAGGATSHYSNSYNTTVNAGLVLNWTLFDGGRMFLVKRSLNSLDSLGSIQLKNSVLQTVYDVVVAYYDIVQQKQQLVSINEVIAYNKERVLILQTSFNAGLIPKTTLLQAQIDLNVYRENALAQQTVIVSAKRALLQLLGNGTDTTFDVADSIPLEYTPDKTELINNVYAHNTLLQAARKNLDIAKLAVQDAESQKYPRITINGGYGFSQTNNGAGTTRMSRAWGPQVGAGITMPLYQAGAVSRLAAIAQLQVQSDSTDFDNVKRTLTLEMDNALMAFENQQALMVIEKENELLAKENLEIEFQRLRLGQSTSLDMHQAEESYKESQTRLISIRFNQKIAETKLRQLLADLEQ
jgi:outer membrane protein TolC